MLSHRSQPKWLRAALTVVIAAAAIGVAMDVLLGAWTDPSIGD